MGISEDVYSPVCKFNLVWFSFLLLYTHTHKYIGAGMCLHFNVTFHILITLFGSVFSLPKWVNSLKKTVHKLTRQTYYNFYFLCSDNDTRNIKYLKGCVC